MAQLKTTRGAAATHEPAKSDPLAGLRRLLPVNAIVTLCTASATAAVLATDLPGPQVAAWWLGHVAVAALMMASRLFRSRHAGRHRAARRAGGRLIDLVTSFLSGLLWGAGALFLKDLDQAYQILLITVSGGMIAGSAATMAVVPLAATIYMLSAALPYIAVLIARGDAVGFALGIMSILFTAAMVLTNRLIFSVIARNRLLHEENTALYERVRAAQTELLDIAESSEAFAFTDAAGRLQLWNRRFPALLGLDEQSLHRDADLAELLAAAGLSGLLKSETLSDGASLALPNGRFVRARIRTTPQGDRALIVIDITEQQDLLRRASAARDAALGASQAKTIFLANMSHELRTPLNAIIGFSDVVLQRMFGPDSEKYDEYLRDINGSARHLLEVINEILDLARIEANQIVLNETEVYLDEEIATCARLAASQFGRSKQAVQTEIDASLPPLLADSRLVRQILLNLMSNAFKFSPASTPIEAGAKLGGQKEIEIWVRDFGIGIAKADQTRIFEPFEQADTQLSRNYNGVGLGLSLVRAFVAAHQGRLEIESAPGEGTRIAAIFPAARTGKPLPLTS